MARVRVWGIRGAPPPPTTKLAIFYKGGYEMQVLLNATGRNFAKKAQLLEKQIRFLVGEQTWQSFDVLEFQQIGVPAPNPTNQNSGTMYIRIFAQATTIEPLRTVLGAVGDISLKHFSGMPLPVPLTSSILTPFFFQSRLPQLPRLPQCSPPPLPSLLPSPLAAIEAARARELRRRERHAEFL